MLLPRRQRHREVLPEALDSWSDYAVLKLATAAIRANTWGACPLDRLPFFMPFFLLPCCQKAATSLSMDCAVRTAGMQGGQGRGRGRKAPQAMRAGRDAVRCEKAGRSGGSSLWGTGRPQAPVAGGPAVFLRTWTPHGGFLAGTAIAIRGSRLAVRLTSRHRLSADGAASD